MSGDRGMSDTEADFPVPAFTDIDAIFGAGAKTYLTREQMGADFYGDHNRFTRAASDLLFQGGKLADFGLALKPDIDKVAAMHAIRAWLCSFAPEHEIKIWTVGYALSKWCEDATQEPTPHQAQRRKKRKGGHRIRRGQPAEQA